MRLGAWRLRMSKKMRRALNVLLALPFLLGALGRPLSCGESRPDRFIKVFFPGGASVTAELAVTPSERAKGLMFRKSINPDEGMLFVLEEGVNSFWMKNTLIPLDMIWLDASKTIVHIEAEVPPCKEDPCPSYGPDCDTKYVLELKAGRAKDLSLKLYDRLSFVLPTGLDKPRAGA